jgi:drug/metabolite transporter (DMT)-like permease
LFGLTIAIIAAIGVATISIMLRSMSRTETPSAIVFWFTLLSLPPTGLLMFWFGRGHDPVTWALIAAMGVCGGIAQLLLTNALKWARVAIVLPMASTWVGTSLIVASGLYIVLREHRLGMVATLRAQADADIRA